jgi:hypothetical protein
MPALVEPVCALELVVAPPAPELLLLVGELIELGHAVRRRPKRKRREALRMRKN